MTLSGWALLWFEYILGSRQQLFLGIPCSAPVAAESRLTWWGAEEYLTFLPEFLLWGIYICIRFHDLNCKNKIAAPWCCTVFGKWVFQRKSHAWSTWYVLNVSKGHKMLEDCASVFGLCPRKNHLSEFCILLEFSAKFLKKLSSCTPWLFENPSCILGHNILSCLNIFQRKTLMPKSLSFWGQTLTLLPA